MVREKTLDLLIDSRVIVLVEDYFIVNMSIADLLVGSVCIPFYIPYRSVDRFVTTDRLAKLFTLFYSLTDRWPFGETFCRIWVRLSICVRHVETTFFLCSHRQRSPSTMFQRCRV